MSIDSFDNSEDASRAALAYLHRRFGFALWMVTRVDGDDWNILYTEDHGYDIAGGASFRWSDSFCMRMVSGRSPRFAPRATEIPEYVSAEIGQKIEIGSYIGMPLTLPDGTFFGTLCAIDPVEHGASMTSTVLARETEAIEQPRRLAASGHDGARDAEMGLLEHSGWQRVSAIEDVCARLCASRRAGTARPSRRLARRRERRGRPRRDRARDRFRRPPGYAALRRVDGGM